MSRGGIEGVGEGIRRRGDEAGHGGREIKFTFQRLKKFMFTYCITSAYKCTFSREANESICS